jgi:hypothetical protein
MTKRRRAERRAQDRTHEKLGRDLERLWKVGPGGSPDRAIVLSSAAEVEVHARSIRCPICEGELRVEEHAAEAGPAGRLRVARTVCSFCHARRSVYYRLADTLLN